MNRRAVAAVVRRDLRIAAGSKPVVLPAVIVPAILLVIVPAMAGLLPLIAEESAYSDLTRLVGLLPDEDLLALPGDPGQRIAYLLVVYLLTPTILLVPVLFASVIAADGVAGERERGTLEGLLLTPMTDQELATAKLLAAWLPSVALGVGGAAVYALVANLTVGLQLGRLVLPTAEYAVLTLWVGPTLAAAALGLVSLVSVRVSTTQEAFQLGGLVVLPIVALLVSQASGALLLSPWILVVLGALAAAIAAVVVRLGARGMARSRLGPRLN